MRPALGGIADHGVQQRLGHAAPPSVSVHPDVVDVGAFDPPVVGVQHRADEGPAGPGDAVVLDVGDPPVVPSVAGVLAQSLDELGEALAVGVEVVGEGLLEHPVHGLQVGGHGRARRRGSRRGGRPRPRAAPAVRPASACSGRTGRLICSQVRTWSYPAADSQRCWRASAAYAPESSWVPVRPRSVVTSAATAPAQAKQEPASRSATSSARSGAMVTSTTVRPAARSWTLTQASSRALSSRSNAWRRVHEPVPTSAAATAGALAAARPLAQAWNEPSSAVTSSTSARPGGAAVTPSGSPGTGGIGSAVTGPVCLPGRAPDEPLPSWGLLQRGRERWRSAPSDPLMGRIATSRAAGAAPAGQPAWAFTSRRRILPVGPFGSSGTTQTRRGYL